MKLFLLLFLGSLTGNISEGYTLFSPLPSQVPSNGYNTYLIDNNEDIINQWTYDCKPVTISYLLPDSSLVVPCSQDSIQGLGNSEISGGRILKLNWSGEVLWDDIFVDTTYEPHHDIEPMENGNILFIAYERKTYEEAVALGRVSINDEMWPSKIIEIEQVTLDSSRIVWEWNLWDHLIQNVDSSLPNFGVISSHPELMDINIGSLGGGGGSSGDWLHLNSIDYHEFEDVIIFSSRKLNEIYIIDHSTTTQEAASSSGGRFNKGGDILYRWGNPQNYGRGAEIDQELISQHSVNWIEEEFPGGGDIILFNNRTIDLGAEILQLSVSIEDSTFNIQQHQTFLPAEPSWTYSEGSFFSNIQSGSFRLCNGNTLISLGSGVEMFEINNEDSVVWIYSFSGPSGQYFNGNIPRYQKFDPHYFNYSINGDLNNNSVVDIEDILLIIDYILDNINFYISINVLDLNEDTNVDVFDIIILVNLVLGA